MRVEVRLEGRGDLRGGCGCRRFCGLRSDDSGTLGRVLRDLVALRELFAWSCGCGAVDVVLSETDERRWRRLQMPLYARYASSPVKTARIVRATVYGHIY